MDEEIKKSLHSLGLSDKEIYVYIALLELGESPVNKITERSELNRVTVYPVLKSLIEKGFVSKFLMERKSHFKAIMPNQILEIIKEKEESIKEALPKLNAISHSIKSTTSVELFKGSKGISSFLEKLYSGDEKEFWAYGNGELIDEMIKYQSLHGRKLRINKKIKMNIIVNPIKREYLENPEYAKLTKIKFNSKLKDINVYIVFGKKLVGIFELTKELSAIIIENEEIANYHKFIYDGLMRGMK